MYHTKTMPNGIWMTKFTYFIFLINIKKTIVTNNNKLNQLCNPTDSESVLRDWVHVHMHVSKICSTIMAINILQIEFKTFSIPSAGNNWTTQLACHEEDDKYKTAVMQLKPSFRLQKLGLQYYKCLSINGNYVEKKSKIWAFTRIICF